MRPKVVIAMLLLAAGLLAGIVFLSKAIRQPVTASADNATVPATVTASNQPVKVIANPQPVVITTSVVSTNDAAAHAKYVARRIEELNALAMNDDVQSRDAILSEVKNNPDKKIRAAALAAAIQFDDRSVVPPLQAIADQTADPDEKQSILEAINYINLPSISEYMAANPNAIPRSTPKTPPIRHAPNGGPSIPPSNSQ